jgi:hypothetical protein
MEISEGKNGVEEICVKYNRVIEYEYERMESIKVGW